MIKRQISVLLWSILLPIWSFSQDSTDIDEEIDVIKVVLTKEVEAVYAPSSLVAEFPIPVHVVDDNDLYRNKLIVMLNMKQRENRGLLEAQYERSIFRHTETGSGNGLIYALIDGMRCGKIQALQPHNLQRRYTYPHLVNDLSYLRPKEEVVEEEDESGLPSLSEYGIADVEQEKKSIQTKEKIEYDDIENLSLRLDLVCEEGFSADRARRYRRLCYLRVIWVDPQRIRPNRVLAIFYYPEIEAYLKQAFMTSNNNETSRMSISDFLNMNRYKGRVIPASADRIMTAAELRGREEHLWDR